MCASIKYSRITVSVMVLIALLSSTMSAQGTASAIEPRSLIDMPTAGLLPHGNVAIGFEIYQPGGLLAGVSIGVLDRLLFGLSYGGTELIGDKSPVWNPSPGIEAKIRFLDETVLLPALALGFNSQGREAYIASLDRYTIKSPGFYAVASKNYALLGYLSLHGGINYSLERADGDEDPNFFLGAEKTLGPLISILGEYNSGLNDSHHQALGRGRGYLNFGARLTLGKGLILGLNLKDIARNQDKTTIGNRVLTLEYIQPL